MDRDRARIYRLVFAFAATYNLTFGLWAALRPDDFFDLFDMPTPTYPSIWACLGMVVGLYGVLCAYAAKRLDRARPIIAVGLAGKLLGPIGWLLTVRSGEWPVRTFTLITLNDIIWWVPFTLFLIDGTRLGERVRRAAPLACALLNGLGALALATVLRPGSELEPDIARRAEYISSNTWLWHAGWLAWYGAALSLLGFYAWWGARLSRPRWVVAALAIAMVGVFCDLTAESLLIGWLGADFVRVHHCAMLLTGGAANGLYTVAGILLMRETTTLGRGLRLWGWAVWLCGIALTAATVFGSLPGMAVATGVLMLLFCPWVVVLGRRLA